jgi:hypothetical protein
MYSARNQLEVFVSLTVSPQLIEDAHRGTVSDAQFIDCVRTSLPYAYDVVERLCAEFSAGDQPFSDNDVPPPDEAARGQLLRAMSSNAIRGALERHFHVALAFQNCHRVAVFAPNATQSNDYLEFISLKSQVLNQRPEFVNC